LEEFGGVLEEHNYLFFGEGIGVPFQIPWVINKEELVRLRNKNFFRYNSFHILKLNTITRSLNYRVFQKGGCGFRKTGFYYGRQIFRKGKEFGLKRD